MTNIKSLSHQIADFITQITLDAAEIAVKIQNTEFTTHYKKDNSPVTDADLAVNEYLLAQINQKYPQAGILSEEEELSDLYKQWNKKELLFIVDPIDGTGTFARGCKEWSVCIAVLKNQNLIASIIYLPKLNLCYRAIDQKGAYINNNKIKCSQFNQHNINYWGKITSDISINFKGEVNKVSKRMSLAYRFMLLLEEKIDILLINNETVDWDIAPADLILREAGIKLKNINDGMPLKFGNDNYTQPPLYACRPGIKLDLNTRSFIANND